MKPMRRFVISRFVTGEIVCRLGMPHRGHSTRRKAKGSGLALYPIPHSSRISLRDRLIPRAAAHAVPTTRVRHVTFPAEMGCRRWLDRHPAGGRIQPLSGLLRALPAPMAPGQDLRVRPLPAAVPVEPARRVPAALQWPQSGPDAEPAGLRVLPAVQRRLLHGGERAVRLPAVGHDRPQLSVVLPRSGREFRTGPATGAACPGAVDPDRRVVARPSSGWAFPAGSMRCRSAASC